MIFDDLKSSYIKTCFFEDFSGQMTKINEDEGKRRKMKKTKENMYKIKCDLRACSIVSLCKAQQAGSG